MKAIECEFGDRTSESIARSVVVMISISEGAEKMAIRPTTPA